MYTAYICFNTQLDSVLDLCDTMHFISPSLDSVSETRMSSILPPLAHVFLV